MSDRARDQAEALRKLADLVESGGAEIISTSVSWPIYGYYEAEIALVGQRRRDTPEDSDPADIVGQLIGKEVEMQLPPGGEV